jgi:hypothetical protein
LRFLSITVSLFWFLFYSFVNSWLCRFFFSTSPEFVFLQHQTFPDYIPTVGFFIIFVSGFGYRHQKILMFLLQVTLSSTVPFLSFVLPLGSTCRYRILSDRRTSLFGTASRFRFSIAGITFRFHRSMGALAYGPPSLL